MMAPKHKYLITTSTQAGSIKERIINDMKVEYDKPMTTEDIETLRDKIINSYPIMVVVTITNIFKFETPAE